MGSEGGWVSWGCGEVGGGLNTGGEGWVDVNLAVSRFHLFVL